MRATIKVLTGGIFTRSNAILAAVVVSGVCTANRTEAQQVFLHGFATQAYGQTTDYAQAGLAGNGTADMRAAALQGRITFFSTGTQFVVQGAHRRVGGSPLATVIDDVDSTGRSPSSASGAFRRAWVAFRFRRGT